MCGLRHHPTLLIAIRIIDEEVKTAVGTNFETCLFEAATF